MYYNSTNLINFVSQQEVGTEINLIFSLGHINYKHVGDKPQDST